MPILTTRRNSSRDCTTGDEKLTVAGAPILVWITLALAALALGLSLIPTLRYWQRRRRLWLEDPDRLTEPSRPAPQFDFPVLLINLAVIVVAIYAWRAWPMPFAAWLAGIGALTARHVRSQPVLGAVGLFVVGLGVVVAVSSWWLPSLYGVVLGCAIAGCWMAWLNKFWDQQLLDGVPWTTAGRMIPIARVLAIVAAVAGAGFAGWILRTRPATPGLVSAIMLGLFLLLLTVMQIVAALRVKWPALAIGAAFSAMALGMVAWAGFTQPS